MPPPPPPPSIVLFRPDALAPSPRSGFPEWILLNKNGLISVDRNETTAECETSEGQPVALSFWLVDAPDVSSFSVDCPGLPEKVLSLYPPFIICAEGPFVLFCVVLNVPHWKSFHLFLYTASEKPSLHLLPEPADCVVQSFQYLKFAILPSCGDHHRDYAVAFLDWEGKSYYANIFSSKTRSWIRKKALLDLPEAEKSIFHKYEITKQFTVGSSSVAWVDLLLGVIVLSNLFDQQPVIKYIPFPASRVRIADKDETIADKDETPTIAVEYFRDVSCCDGLIKFVEIEFDEPNCRSNDSTWKAIIWSRKVSWDNWRKLYTVDVADISVDSSYAALLPELLDKNTNQLKLKNLIFLAPTLSMQDDNLLYTMSKVNFEEDASWIIAVDMEHKAVKALAQVSAKTYCSYPMYFQCSFPKYLNNMAPADMLNPAIVPQVPQQKKRRKRGGKKKKKNPAEVLDVRFGLYFSFILSILTAASFAAVVAYRLISMS